MKIFFYAFANTSYIFNEVVKLSLENNEEIEWGMIYPRAVHKDSALGLVDKENILYLFENFDSIYTSLKEEDIEFDSQNWLDNIYTILESSKFGYKKQKSERQLKVAYTIYTIYKNFLIKNRPDFLIFPDIETVNGVLLLNICKELEIETMVTVHTRQLDFSFFAQDYRETLPVYFGNLNDDDSNKAKKFVTQPIQKAIIGNQIGIQKIEIKVHSNIFQRLIKTIETYFKYEKNGIFDTNLYLRIRLNFEKYFEIWREFFFNYYQVRFFEIKSDNDYIPDKYILLLLQVTPESSINTYTQYFIEQERVIDLLRLNMPTNYKLLVKEHPAMRGMRANKWYENMRIKAGVSLVSHKINTMNLMKKSQLVATVTGSVGLECYHIDKPVIMFGQTFFSHLVHRFNCINSFKIELEQMINVKYMNTEDKKMEEIAKIYNVSYDFFIHEPFHFERVMTKKNINNFLLAIHHHIYRLGEFKKDV